MSPPRRFKQPGDRIGGGQQECLRTLLLDLGRDPRPLVGVALAGVALLVPAHGCDRGRRTVGPDGVDRVRVEGHEAAALGLGDGLEPVALALAGEPRVVAQLHARRQVLLEPGAQGLLDHVPPLEQRRVDLLRDLHGVAPVAEHGGRVHGHRGLGGRAGEAGEPGHPLGIARQVLAAVLVGAHQHERVDAALAQGARAGGAAGRHDRPASADGRAQRVRGARAGLPAAGAGRSLPTSSSQASGSYPGGAAAMPAQQRVERRRSSADRLVAAGRPARQSSLIDLVSQPPRRCAAGSRS